MPARTHPPTTTCNAKPNQPGAIGAVISMGATYPLITVVTLRALETVDDGGGGRRLPGALAMLPSAVQEVVHVREREGGGCSRGLGR